MRKLLQVFLLSLAAHGLVPTALDPWRGWLTKDGCLTPVDGVVCESVSSKTRHPVPDRDQWSFDYASFERFVDIVEQEPVFQDLIVSQPLWSAVYWEDA